MIFKGLDFNNELIKEPVKIEVFYSDIATIWTIQKKDENGFQVDSVEYANKKSVAIDQAIKEMNEISTIKQVDIFTKNNKLHRTIQKGMV